MENEVVTPVHESAEIEVFHEGSPGVITPEPVILSEEQIGSLVSPPSPESAALKVIKRRRRVKKVEDPVVPEDNRCPACANGLSIEVGQHILNTPEHPLPVAQPAPEKQVRQQPRIMHKEFRQTASFAAKLLPKKVEAKARAMAEVARLEAEIQELVRVSQALGGMTPVGMPMPSFNEIQQPYQPAPNEKYDPTNPQHNPMINFRTAQAPALRPTVRGGAVGNFDAGEVLNGPVPLDDGLPPGEWIG